MARWRIALLLPLAGFFILLAQSGWDGHWENHKAHFWLVFGVALVNAALGFVMSEAARRRGDARVFLVGLVFLTTGGFLALHALATPGVLLDGKNTGFVVATPVGLFLRALSKDHELRGLGPRDLRGNDQPVEAYVVLS